MSLAEDTLDTYPPALRKPLAKLCELIQKIAYQSTNIGSIETSLKWGQLSFATNPKTGTPVRIDGNAEQGTYSVFVSCSTTLISRFRDVCPDMFDYHGNREIRFDIKAPFPEAELAQFVHAALTYYLE